MNKQSILLIYLLVGTCFSKELFTTTLVGVDFDIFGYPLVFAIFLYLLVTGRLVWRKFAGSLLIVSLFQLLWGVIHGGSSPVLFFKQLIPIFLYLTVFTHFIIRYGVYPFWSAYINLACVTAGIGVVQLVFKLSGKYFLTDLSGYGIDSIAAEPSHLAAILLPAVVYSLFFMKKRAIFLLLPVYLMTLKTTSYVALAAMKLLLYRRSYKLIFMFALVGGALIFTYTSFFDMSDRIDGVVEYIGEQDLGTVKNTTVFSFVTNLEVALSNFKNSLGIGFGFGSHECAYFKSPVLDVVDTDYRYGLNAKSAHSLMIRAFSELGIAGIALLIHLLLPLFRKSTFDRFSIIYASCFSHFIVKSMKLGGYFDYGTLFFLSIMLIMQRSVGKLIPYPTALESGTSRFLADTTRVKGGQEVHEHLSRSG